MIKHLFILLFVTKCWAKDTGYFWFISDFHYDPTYRTSQVSCNDQIPLDKLGRFGDYECDSSYDLVVSSLQATKRHGPFPDFVIWAGDNPPHPKNKTYLDRDLVMEITRNMTMLMKNTWPGVQVYSTLGNHDYYPTSQLPADYNPVYEELAQMWADWINNTETNATGTFKKYASYVLPLRKPGFKMIVVNTNIYYRNDEVTKGDEDPGGQFMWLEGKLQQARDAGEKVHILTHIPSGTMGSAPGVHWFNEHHNTRFNQIIRKFSDVILATYGVHQHTDAFHVFYNGGSPVAVQIIVPSVTPWRARVTSTIRGEARNPGVRKFYYNRDNMMLLYYEQYYFSIPEARTRGSPEWKMLYDTRAVYGIQNLTAKSLNGLVNSFEGYASEIFHRYHEFNSVKAFGQSSNPPCSANCKASHICAIKNVDYSDYNECYKTAISKASFTELSLTLTILVVFWT